MTDDEILKVVQAHKEGKRIQGKSPQQSNVWVDLTVEPIIWNFMKCEYRIAPEPRKPREFWLCNGRDRSDWVMVPETHSTNCCGGEKIKVREVLENE